MTAVKSPFYLFAFICLITGCTTGKIQKHLSPAARQIKVSQDDPAYFSFSDGSPYIPIGINMINPSGRYSEKPDSAFYEIEQWMKNLSENGGNYIRVWLSNSFWDIEEEAGKYIMKKCKELIVLLKRRENIT